VTTTVLRHVGELTTNDSSVGDCGPMGRIFDAAMVVDDEWVLWVGPDDQAPSADESIDLDGAAVIPGFVDSHTHLVFAGERSDEFEARMAGQRYDGGGITRTVQATRAAHTSELESLTRARMTELFASGVTTVEIKSGYDLTVEGEARLLEIAGTFSDEVTFLGAHVLAPEYAHRRDDYVALVCDAMLDRCAPLARWADVFCEEGAFSVDESLAILSAASEAGLGLRVHGNQLGHSGGVALAVELDAASVDHCAFLSDDDVYQLAASNTVATLLPGAEFSTRAPYPDAARLVREGVTIALASDCNPGSSYLTNMGVVIALAVREMGLSCDEALRAATWGGARALRRDDVGHLGVGARADYVVLRAPRAAHLAYRLGASLVAETNRASRPPTLEP